MYALTLLIYMTLTARMCGGGLGAYKLPTIIPEILFAIPFGVAAYLSSGYIALGLIGFAISTLAMRTGHGVILHWGDISFFAKYPDILEDVKKRQQALSPVVNALASMFSIEKRTHDGVHSLAYCRLFMAVKGFFIGLPIGGVPLAVLWPLGYEAGKRLGKPEICEYLTGLLAGLALVIFIEVAR